MSDEKKKLVLDEKDLMKAAQTMKPTRYVPPPRPVGEQLPRYEFKSQRPLMSYFPWKTLFALTYLMIAAFFYYKYDQKSALNITSKSLEYILTSNVMKSPLKKNPAIKKKLEWLQAEVKQKQKFSAATISATTPEATDAPPAANPALLIGHKFSYRYRIEDKEKELITKDSVVDWELVDNQGQKLTWEGSDGNSVNSMNPFLPPLKFDGSSLLPSEQNKIEGDPREIFPLTEGKVVRYQVTPMIIGHDKPYEYTCTVGHQVSTVTAMGTLKTIRVTCVSDEAFPRTALFFFSPRMNHWVKQESDLYIGGRHYAVHAELTSYAAPEASARAPAAVSN